MARRKANLDRYLRYQKDADGASYVSLVPGIAWDLTAQARLPDAGPALLTANTASSAAIASTASETAFDVTHTVPAASLAVGDVLRLTAWGTNATHSSGTVTIHFVPRWGGVAGVALASLATITLATSTSYEWHLDVRAVVRSIGASASVAASARLIVNKNADDSVIGNVASGDISTIDTTADEALVITVQHGAAQSANTATLHGYVLERLRA